MTGLHVLLGVVLAANAAADFPAQARSAPSPGKYVIVNVDRDSPDERGNWHELFLDERASRARFKLLSYGRHVTVLWAPSSRAVAVNDFAGSDYARPFVFVVQQGEPEPRRIDLERLTAGTPAGTALAGAGHRFLTAEHWNRDGSLALRARGYGGGSNRSFDVLLRFEPSSGSLREDSRRQVKRPQ